MLPLQWTRPTLWLAALLVAIHAYFLWVMGATFWFDTMDYVNLGHEIIPLSDGTRFFYLQHQGIGEGFLWATMLELCGPHAWLGLAVVQHALACLATCYFVLCLRPVLAWPGVFLTGILISCHPFLRAFDNSIMTESVTLSAMLFCLGTSVKILVERDSPSSYTILLLAAVLGIQFRSYFLVVAGCCLGLLWLAKETRRQPWYRSIPALAFRASCLAMSFVFFPCLRWLGTGMFLLPNFHYWDLPIAIENNPTLSPAFFSSVEASLPAEMNAEVLTALAAQEMNIGPWADLATRMVRQGRPLAEIDRAFADLAWAIRTESKETMANQLSLSLYTLGFTRCDLWFAADRQIRRAANVREACAQPHFYYRWFSWVAAPDYSVWFHAYVRRFREQPAMFPPHLVDQFESHIGPYLQTTGVRRRDPLFLSRISPDLWLLAALLGFVALFRRAPALGFLFVMPIAVNYVVMLLCGLNGIRYFYVLLPIYLFVTAHWLAAWMGQALLWIRTLGNRRNLPTGSAASAS